METRQSPEPGPILHHASRKWLLENGPKGMSAAQTAFHLLIQVTGVEGSFLECLKWNLQPLAEQGTKAPAAAMAGRPEGAPGGARGW